MRKILLIVVLILILVAGVTEAVPYPYGEYSIDTEGDPTV